MKSDDFATGLGAGAAQATTLTLGETAPDTEFLAVDQGVLEAFVANDATTTHLFGLAGRCTAFGKEKIRIDAEAVGLVLPAPFRAEL